MYEYWGFWDAYGDGTVVPIVASWVGDVMVRCEVSPYPHGKLPFIFIPYLPIKDSLYGESDAPLLETHQDIISAVSRGMIDTIASAAAGQKGIPTDMLTRTEMQKFKSGQDFEIRDSGMGNQLPIWVATPPEISQSAFAMLQHHQYEASSLTGIQPFSSSGLSGDSLGSTATGVSAATDAQGKREFCIMARIADGLAKMGSHIMAMNGDWLEDHEVIRITDSEFVHIQRENLKGSFDVDLSISTKESDANKAQQLAFMLQTMGPSLPYDMIKLLLQDISKLYRMPGLADSISKYQPQPSPTEQLEQAKLQVEVEKAQLEVAKIQAEINHINAQAGLKASQSEKLC